MRTPAKKTPLLDSRRMVESLLDQHTPVSFMAQGSSMNPTIRNGEIVRLRPAKNARLQPGSIVLYPRGDRLVLHRLIRKQANTCLIAGDASLLEREQIEAERILGIAESLQRDGRTVPLNTPVSRLRGLLRYRMRPLRRLAGALQSRSG